MGLPNCAANRIAEMKLGRESRKGKFMDLIVKYWVRIFYV
jgi:hypothetical protein